MQWGVWLLRSMSYGGQGTGGIRLRSLSFGGTGEAGGTGRGNRVIGGVVRDMIHSCGGICCH
jgi:hypothetical protein